MCVMQWSDSYSCKSTLLRVIFSEWCAKIFGLNTCKDTVSASKDAYCYNKGKANFKSFETIKAH